MKLEKPSVKLTKELLEIANKCGFIILLSIIIFFPELATEWAAKSPFEEILGVKIKDDLLEKSNSKNLEAQKNIEAAIKRLDDKEFLENEAIKPAKDELNQALLQLGKSLELQEKAATGSLSSKPTLPIETKESGHCWVRVLMVV
jgi:hypothetical protein